MSEPAAGDASMRIGMVLRGFFPHDVRVEKEARALSAAGHDVHLLCLGREEGREPTYDRVGPIAVRRIHRRERYTTVQRTAKTVRYLLTLTDVIWRREMARFVEEERLDALHVHDLPLVRTGLAVAEAYDCPLVADLHENYPEAARQWRTGMALPRRTVQTLFTPVPRLKRLERDGVRRADRVLAVTEEGKAHYVADCGVSPSSVAVVSNTVDLDTFDAETPPVDGYEEEFVLGYVGSFGPHRGLETAIEAMPAVVERVPNARLLVVGSAGEAAYDRHLREVAEETGVGERITFTGWVDFEAVPAHIAAIDLPFVLHRDNPHTATTVPHKLFQYMAMRKPVLVTDVGTLGRVVREADCGRVVADGDSAAVADATVELAEDPALREQLGEHARGAVERTYNWERETATLRGVYRDLATSAR
ncbi:glycosyltransferase family 4 protein [Halomarina ordinaria]|uniref:Glycosyltransferase family 4 protein n=1 Tax=Halomarina ordinaria TaxID=3033939 RepID=A0ABD5UDI5_9EURY|nr:glycosyltransferase family 4 protein [Halomarina sp. PSRA2]